ncbi:MAG TPA: DNA mismatch repair endonuclease MutL [Gemmatimonadaceae bacterium]|nr:DNA mismatch repair endonuclease MutL [Gemmatimonadaceae bacterium]
MPLIAVLPGAVADQIAAGEVVERPASVVKELIENALDAGATSIDITIEEGGRSAIRISDDGCGMDRDDVVLALERHATSKIRRAEDLVGVSSFGFRGEALPAICSVAHLELETSLADGGGTRVRAAGGSVVEVGDSARRRGTTVSVQHLFFNTPARQKFLRGARSEWRAIIETIIAVALVRRDVRFTVQHDGKSVLSLPSAPALRDRIAELWGPGYAERFVAVDHVSGPTLVTGLVERPADVGTAGRRVHIAVNGRVIRDGGLVRAAETAYRSTLPAGLRPTLFLELVVPADSVDVNVHPAKAEVRLRERWLTERAVEQGVRRALGTFESAAVMGTFAWPGRATDDEGEHRAVDVEVLRTAPAADDSLFAGARPGAAPADVVHAAVPVVPPLVQLRRTWMMFEQEQGVVLIDQHSAHERILFERFMRILETGESPSQRLLFPMTLHLGPAEGEAFESNRELLARLGFEVEGFGGHTLLVHSVPLPHPRFDAEACLRETLAALSGDRGASAAARHERLAATVACKAAIKAGDALSPEEMRALFLALERTTLPAHDVHGRATIVQLGWDELERRFGRR